MEMHMERDGEWKRREAPPRLRPPCSRRPRSCRYVPETTSLSSRVTRRRTSRIPPPRRDGPCDRDADEPQCRRAGRGALPHAGRLRRHRAAHGQVRRHGHPPQMTGACGREPGAWRPQAPFADARQSSKQKSNRRRREADEHAEEHVGGACGPVRPVRVRGRARGVERRDGAGRRAPRHHHLHARGCARRRDGGRPDERHGGRTDGVGVDRRREHPADGGRCLEEGRAGGAHGPVAPRPRGQTIGSPTAARAPS